MKKELEDIKTILELETLSDSSKLEAIKEIVGKRKTRNETTIQFEAPAKKKRIYRKRIKRRPLAQEEIDYVYANLFESNRPVSISVLARKLGRTMGAIRNIKSKLKKGDLKPSGRLLLVSNFEKNKEKRYKKPTNTDIDTIFRELHNGNSVKKIAKLLGRSVPSVYGIIKRNKSKRLK